MLFVRFLLGVNNLDEKPFLRIARRAFYAWRVIQIMKRIGLLLVFVLSFAAITFAGNEFKLIKVRGKVNVTDIGGNGLCVISLWDKSGGFPIGPDGDFESVISDSRPQKLFVKDDKMKTRALAIVFPEKTVNIIFDAESTALALLFRDPTYFSNSSKAASFSTIALSSNSLQELISFLKSNLSTRSLEELVRDQEYMELFQNCNKEILGQDHDVTMKSLNEAKGQLEKIMSDYNM